MLDEKSPEKTRDEVKAEMSYVVIDRDGREVREFLDEKDAQLWKAEQEHPEDFAVLGVTGESE